MQSILLDFKLEVVERFLVITVYLNSSDGLMKICSTEPKNTKIYVNGKLFVDTRNPLLSGKRYGLLDFSRIFKVPLRDVSYTNKISVTVVQELNIFINENVYETMQVSKFINV